MSELFNNQATMMSEGDCTPRIGVYVCHCGGNISHYVDVEAVTAEAGKMKDVVVAKHNMFVCSDPGQDMIIEDIRNGLVNRVVIASCSPGLHELTFRHALVRAGLNPYLYVHVNIREQVSWVAHGESATMKATSLVAGGVAKARLIQALDMIRVEAVCHATVVGAGVAGLKAAWDLARNGTNVTIVEKTPFLGGFAAKLDKLFPNGASAADLLSQLTRNVLSHERIQVLTCADVTAQEGYIGNFTLKIERKPPTDEEILAKLAQVKQVGGNELIPYIGVCPTAPPTEKETITVNTGAVVMATGFSSYQPKKGEYGYGDSPQVVTLADLIQILAEDQASKGQLTVNGRKIKSMAMIHCVGSRQVKGIHEPAEGEPLRQHCSRTCCTSVVYSALNIRKRFPDTEVFSLFRDIRTYGRGHEELYLEAAEAGVRFIRFRVEDQPVVTQSDDKDYPLSINIKDIALPEDDLELPVDLIVLATGMLPGKIKHLLEVMKTQTGPDGFLQEVHPKIRPVEVATAGIYLAGSCQAPMNVTEAVLAASAASAKVAAILSRDMVELEPFVARVEPRKCSACLTCVRTCPFGVPKIKEGKAYIEPAACYGCGACVGECPGKAITLEHYGDEHLLASEKAMINGLPDTEKAA